MSDSEVFRISADKYQFWAIDHAKRQVTIVPQEGENFTGPLEDEGIAVLPDIAHTIFDWEKWWIHTITRRDHTIFTMGYNATSPTEARPHRPTIYLDQNKWSELARQCWSRARPYQRRHVRRAGTHSLCER